MTPPIPAAPPLDREQLLAAARQPLSERDLLERLLMEVILLRQLVEHGLSVPEEPCAHPEARRADQSAMGYTEWTCRDCGHHYDSREAS